MKKLWFLSFFLLCGFTPIETDYSDKDKIMNEFQNVEESVQDNQFRVFTSTPNLSDLKDHEVVIFSSGAVRLMFRNNQDLYSINASCITIRR